MKSKLRCPECGSCSVKVKPDEEEIEEDYLFQTDYYDRFGSSDFGCTECEEGHSIQYASSLAKTLFQSVDDSTFDVLAGQPGYASFPCIVWFEGDYYEIGMVEAQEEFVHYYFKNNTGKVAVTIDREDVELREITEFDRKKMKYRNLTQIFGEAHTYECRICSRPLDDGRKNYCSNFCRQNAYSFRSKYDWNQVREKVLKRDDFECVECGSSENLEVDHIQAVAKGGSLHDPSNLQTLCRECHKKKGRAMGDYSASKQVDKSLEVYVDG